MAYTGILPNNCLLLKMWPLRTAVACLLLMMSMAPVCAQEPTPAAEPEHEFVSGSVSELSPGRIVVNRAVIGKPPEDRAFLINADTKVEGTLKVGVRVTVGFKSSDEGEVAVRIIVRSK